MNMAEIDSFPKMGSSARPTFHSRIFFKLIIPYIVLIAIVFSLSGWLFFSSARKALDEELSRRLGGVADLVASTLNPQFLMRIQPGDEDTSLYRLILTELGKIQKSTRVKDIYLFDRKNRVIASLDGAQLIGEENIFLQIDSFELEQVWSGRTVSSVLYRGRDGRFYKAGYAPVRNGHGEVIAAAGVEVGADFMEIMDRIQRQFVWITLASGGFIIMISFLLSRSIIRPIQILAFATEQLGSEDSYPQINLRRNDELGDLGRYFNRMTMQLKTKDAQLRRMVDEERARVEVLEGYSETLLKSIPSGVLGVNPDGVMTSSNPAAENILGLSASLLLGKDVRDVLSGYSHLAGIIMATLSTGKETPWKEFSVEDRVKGNRWIGAMASPIKDHGGKQIGATAVFADLTEVKNLQEEVVLKRQMALLGELSAGMAHEIRNPLAAIQPLGELLGRRARERADRKNESEEFEEEDLEDLSGDLVTEIGHLNRFVTEFLTYARMPVLKFETTDIQEMIDSALSLAFPQGMSGRIIVRKSVPVPSPRISVDPLEFRRVLLNLIQNAAQAMGGEGELRIECRVIEGHFLLRISDTGPGIPFPCRDKIFRPFFTTKQGGTGLGLAISQRIIGEHGGTLTFETAEGKGAAFIVQIRIRDD